MLPFDLQRCSSISNTENSISRISQADSSKPILSRSSTFCTSMYSTSSANSNSCRQTSALPFLPHPPRCAQQQQQTSAEQSSSSSSLLYSADLNGGGHDDTEHSEDLRNFLNLSEDASEGSFHGESNAMTFSDQMEFQFLSEQLGIAMTDNEESPRLDVRPLVSPLILMIRICKLFTTKTEANYSLSIIRTYTTDHRSSLLVRSRLSLIRRVYGCKISG